MTPTGDRGTVALIALVVGAVLFATTLATCDAREERRAAASVIAAAEARAAAARVASARLATPGEEEQVRQRLEIEALRQQVASQRVSFEDQRELHNSAATLLGSLLALVGFLLPLLLYFTSIRPSEKIVEEARQLVGEGLDKRLGALLLKQRLEQVERALEQLCSDDDQSRANGALFFTLNPEAELSPPQLVQAADAMLRASSTARPQIAGAIAKQDHWYVSKTLAEALEETGAPLLHPVVRHAQLASTDDLLLKLKRWAMGPTGREHVGIILSIASTTAPKVLASFIDDESWVTSIGPLARIVAMNVLAITAATTGNQGTVQQSALARSLRGTLKAPVNAQMKDSGLEDAAYVVTLIDGQQKGTVIRGSQAFDDAIAELRSGGFAFLGSERKG